MIDHTALAELLHDIGWRSSCDAQWEGLKAAIPQIRDIVAPDGVVGAKVTVTGNKWRMDYLSLPEGTHTLYLRGVAFSAPEAAQTAPVVPKGFTPAGWFYRTSEFGPWRECRPGQEGAHILYLSAAPSAPAAPAAPSEDAKEIENLRIECETLRHGLRLADNKVIHLEQDAARYRWLRDKANSARMAAPLCWHTDHNGNVHDAATGADLDEAVDAGIAATSQQKDDKVGETA